MVNRRVNGEPGTGGDPGFRGGLQPSPSADGAPRRVSGYSPVQLAGFLRERQQAAQGTPTPRFHIAGGTGIDIPTRRRGNGAANGSSSAANSGSERYGHSLPRSDGRHPRRRKYRGGRASSSPPKETETCESVEPDPKKISLVTNDTLRAFGEMLQTEKPVWRRVAQANPTVFKEQTLSEFLGALVEKFVWQQFAQYAAILGEYCTLPVLDGKSTQTHKFERLKDGRLYANKGNKRTQKSQVTEIDFFAEFDGLPTLGEIKF